MYVCYISHGSSSVKALNGGSIGVEVTAAIERERVHVASFSCGLNFCDHIELL